MKKRYIVPASVAAVATVASAMPVNLLAFNDVFDGTTMNQGILFYMHDRNDLALENVGLEVYDVNALSAKADGTYDLTGLTPVKTYTTSKDTGSEFAMSFKAGTYVVRVTAPDNYVIGKYSSEKNAQNEFIITVPELSQDNPQAFRMLEIAFFEKGLQGVESLSLTVIDLQSKAVPGVVVNVKREALDGSVYDLGDYTSNANGVVVCPADTNDAAPAGSQYIFTVKEYPDGYGEATSNKVLLQPIVNYNSGSLFIKNLTNGKGKVTVINDGGVNVAYFPVKLTDANGNTYNYTTDENGVVTLFDIPNGNYTVSYGGNSAYISHSYTSIYISDWFTETTLRIVDNTPTANGKIHIVNEDSEPIAGLVAEIQNSEGRVVRSEVSDANGYINIYGLGYGDYKLVLKDVPDLYESNNGTYEQTFSVNSSNNFFVNCVLYNNTAMYGDCHITLDITDVDTDDYLYGETVKILNTNNEVLREVAMDEDGLAEFTNLPEGTYHFELSENSKYYIIEDQEVTVGGRNKLAWHSVQAKKLTTTLVLSAQCNNPELVSKLSISLYKNGSIYGTFKMMNGTVTIPNLTVGDYEVVVNDTVEGYRLTSDNNFTIKTSDRVLNQTLVFTEYQSDVNVSVTDSKTGNPVENVGITIKNDRGTVVASGMTSQLGKIVARLPLGTYTVSAIVPMGYATIADTTINVSSITESCNVALFTEKLACNLDINVLDDYGNAVRSGTVEVINSKDQVVYTLELDGTTTSVRVSDLPLDNYVVKVTNLDYHLYQQPTDVTLNLNAARDYTCSFTIDTVHQAAQTGEVSIAMYDENGNRTSVLSDVLIAIFDSNDDMIACDYVLPDGTLQFAELPAGEYKATVFMADSPYATTEKSDVSFTVVAGETTSVNMTLYKGIGAAKFNVTDFTTGLAVEGLTIELFKDGKSVGIYTSDKNGQITIDSMETGIYSYVIVEKPEGYEDVPNNTFNISVDETTIIDIQLTAKTGQAVLNIVDTTGSLLTENVLIVLTDANGIEYNYSIDNGVCNTGWLKTGKYTVTVLNNIEGYTLQTVEDIVIKTDETVYHNIVFKKDLGSANIKVEIQNLTGNIGLPYARIEVRADNNELVGSYVADENGNVSLKDLDIGRYTVNVVESSLPAGYSLLAGAEFTIEKNSEENVVLYVLRETGTLQVYVNDNNGNAMESVDVFVKDDANNVVATLKTDENGMIRFTNIPTGSYNVELDLGDGYTVSGTSRVNIEKDLTKRCFFVVTRHVGSLKVVCNEKVEGVAFDIYSGDKVVGTGVTNSDGEVVVNELPTGTYTVKFTNVPAQYKDLSDATVVITEDNETVLNVNLEEKISVLSVHYAYALGNEPVEGVKFEVTTLDGTVLGEYETDATGNVEVKLPQGYYLVKTKEVPVGYKLPEESLVEIIDGADTGLVINLIESHEFGTFALLIKDSSTSESLTDAVVSLYAQNGSLYKTFTSDSMGQIYAENVAVGNYYAVISKTGYSAKTITDISVLKNEMFLDTVLLDPVVQNGTLTVKVLDDNTGDALKDATVYLRDENDVLIQTATANGAGEVIFSNIPYGNYKLSAEADGYVASGRISTIVAAPEQISTIRLQESTIGSLAVTTINDFGDVISNAVISIKNNEYEYTLIADENGLAALSEIEAGVYTVTVSVDGHEPYTNTLTVVANQMNNLDIVLVEIAQGSVVFTVTDEGGNALVDTEIELSDGSKYTTDENGKLTLNNKGVGSYTAVLKKDGYVTKSVTFTIEKNSTTKISTTLEKVVTTGTLEVVVTDTEGNVLANTSVRINGKTLTTNNEGYAQFTELEAGEYDIEFTKDGYVAKESKVVITAKATTKITVVLAKEVTTGTVNVVAKDGDGQFVENATVEIFDGKTTTVVYTDAYGYLTTDLEAGHYTVTVSKEGYLPVVAEVTVEAGKVYTVNATLVQEILNGNLRVTVADESDNVLEGATVVVNGKALTTDANGVVLFEELEAGEYQVSVSKNGYDTFVATVTINPNKESTLSIKLVKTVTTGDLSVNVTDNNGNKIEGVTVEVNGKTLTTDDNGKVLFDDLEAGTYTVNISKDGYVSESHSVTIIANKTVSMTVDLDKIDTTGDLIVNVTDTNGQVLSNATITIDGKEYTTNAAGVVTIEDIEAGEYEVVISKEGYQSQATTVKVEAGKVYTIDVSLAVEVKVGSAEITVLNADGKVVHNAVVTIKDSENNVVLTDMTDSDGKLYVGNLEIGDYTIHVLYMYTPSEGLEQTADLTIKENQQSNVTVTLPAPYVPETTGDVVLTVQNKDGNLLKDALVTLLNGTVISATTQADGTVAFEDLEPGTYAVTVELYGYHKYTTTITVEVGETTTETIVLDAITTGSLQLTVTDDSNKPLANATVVINGQTYTTDANGLLVINDVEAGRYTATVSANGYVTKDVSVTVEALKTAEYQVSLDKEILRGTGVVIVTDEDGKVLSGVSVTINGKTLLTDSEGKVEFADLEVGTYEVVIHKDGYNDKTVQIGINKDETTTITEKLVQKTGNMHINVYDSEGNVLSNATVTVDGKEYTTDANGVLVITDLTPKTYNVVVSKDGYISQATTLTVTAENVITYNAYLNKVITTGTLTLTVVDENGKALSNATVFVDGKAVTTDVNGMATVTDLEAGNYDVSVSKDGYTSATVNVTITAEKTTLQSVMLEKVITTGSLVVNVTDVNGNALSNATVTIDGKEYTTDDNGNLTVHDLEAGAYQVKVSKSGYNMTTTTAVVNAKETAVVNVVLTEVVTVGKVTVTVVDEKTQAPVSNATIKINGKTHTTDADGKVVLEMTFGTYSAVISKDGYNSITTVLQVNAGEELERTIKLTPLDKTITVIVKDSDGNVLQGAAVNMYSQGGTPQYWNGLTNGDGKTVFELYEHGNYNYTVTLNGYHSEEGTLVINDNTEYVVVVTMYEKVEKATAEFIVTDDNNNPLSNATVTVGEHTGVTDEDGKLILMLPIDYSETEWNYTFTVTKDGYITTTGTFAVDKTAKVTVPVTLEKKIEYGSVNVYVKDKDGNDLQNATVIISNGIESITLQTDKDGIAVLENMLYGEYTITVLADGYYSQVKTVTIDSTDCNYLTVVMEPVIIVADSGTAKITVTDKDGNILVGARVIIIGQSAAINDVYITDQYGQISVSLDVGYYNIIAEYDGYIADGLSIRISKDEITEETIVLEKINLDEYTSVEINLVNQLGEDVLNAEIVVSDSNGIVVYRGTLKGGNTLYLSDLPAGTYTVTATKANHKAATATFTTTLNETTKVELVLEEIIEEVKAGALEILVKNENGTPLSRVIVTILNADGTRYDSYTTLSNGTISLSSLPVGDYILYASYNGINSKRVQVSVVEDQITTVEIIVDANNPGDPNDTPGGNPDDGNGNGNDNVQTGDDRNVGLFGLTALLSAIGALFTKKSKKNKKN